LSLPKTAHLFETGYRGVLENFLEIIRIGLPFNSSTFAVAKKAIDEIGGFPMGIKFGEDVDLWIRLSLKHKIAYMNRSLAIYHQDAENRACDLYYPLMDEYFPVKTVIQMLKNREVPNHQRQPALEYIAKSQLELANSYLHYGNMTEVRKIIHTCSGTRIYIKKWFFLYLCSFIPPLVLRFMIKGKNVF
jgi:hypothetical protein